MSIDFTLVCPRAVRLSSPPSCRATLPKAGHLTNIEQPQLFNAPVLEFLEKI